MARGPRTQQTFNQCMFLLGILLSAGPNFSSASLYPWGAHGMSLYSEMTLKIFDTHYPQMQTGLNKGCSTEAGSWRPLYLGPREGRGH